MSRPYTILMMISDDMRDDECCAADWIRRVYVEGEETDGGIDAMIEDARSQLADLFNWTDDDSWMDEDEIRQAKNTLEPVAIYAGHIFDIYQP